MYYNKKKMSYNECTSGSCLFYSSYNSDVINSPMYVTRAFKDNFSIAFDNDENVFS